MTVIEQLMMEARAQGVEDAQKSYENMIKTYEETQKSYENMIKTYEETQKSYENKIKNYEETQKAAYREMLDARYGSELTDSLDEMIDSVDLTDLKELVVSAVGGLPFDEFAARLQERVEGKN